MTREIQPVAENDLPELSRFLTAGFHAPADAPFASPEVLRWKFLRAEGGPDSPPLSYVARDDDSGAIVGHVGTCRTAFLGRGIEAPVETLHMIDWLGSRGHPSVGSSLMRKAHAAAPTQFGLGGSNAGRAVIERGGYDLVAQIPVYQKVLHVRYWFHAGGLTTAQRIPRIAREIVRQSLDSFRARPDSNLPIGSQPVTSFGAEIGPIVEEAAAHAVLTDRSPDRLNAFLKFPGRSMTGWHLFDLQRRLRGFAILNIVPQDGGKTKVGKIVDCLLDTDAPDLWAGAVASLTLVLECLGAEIAQGYAGTPWLASAFEADGYSTRFALDFRLRDRAGRVPREGPFHIMPIEADYAYT